MVLVEARPKMYGLSGDVWEERHRGHNYEVMILSNVLWKPFFLQKLQHLRRTQEGFGGLQRENFSNFPKTSFIPGNAQTLAAIARKVPSKSSRNFQGSINGGFQTVVRVLSGDQILLPPFYLNLTSFLPQLYLILTSFFLFWTST